MRKTTRLKKLLTDKALLVAPGAYDVLSARIIELVGFQAVYMTGYGTSAAILGEPDVGLLTMSEMARHAGNIADAVDVPVLADGDTGYGNPLNIRRTVREYEKAGVCAIQLEDQVFPKRCGHMLGRKVIAMEEMVQKIKAATDARQDDDFVIIARTDARTTFGLDEALRRGKAYEEAGADVIFIESPEGVEELEAVNKAFPNTPTLANMIEEEVGPCGPRFGLADRITSPLGQWDRRHVSQCPNDRGREVTAYQGFLNTQMGQLGQLGHPDWDKRVIVRFIRGCLPAWSRFRASGWPRALILRAKASWWTGGRR